MHKNTLHILCLITGILFSPSMANSDAFDQGKIQAIYIYNIIKFTSWPQPQADTVNALNICLYGEDNISNELNRLRGEKIQGKVITIKNSNIETELASCHVLYISPENFSDYQDLTELTSGLPILSVGNDNRLLEAGGIISLTQANGRQRFNINLKTLERSGLTLSSKLLALAIIMDE